jgi:hemerythrin-like domain-containing protein
MKRHPRLQDLSREHHGALKLVRGARRAAACGQAGEVQEQARRIAAAFAAELDPHFRAEERDVLPLLSRAGRDDLVQRTLADHREIGVVVARLRLPDAADLCRFADLMEAHVRFEERELFEAAQALIAAPTPAG